MIELEWDYWTHRVNSSWDYKHDFNQSHKRFRKDVKENQIKDGV